jgi:hypothetical protein
MKFDEKIWDKLYELLVPDSGESDSAQGELIRGLSRFWHEDYGNGNGNWEGDKYMVNVIGYPEGYFINRAKEFLDEHPDFLDDSESSRFFGLVSECNDIAEEFGVTEEWIFANIDESEVVYDFAMCNTTQDELNNTSMFDLILNWMKQWLLDYPLEEWDKNYIEKLQCSLESFRPQIPTGVITDESWDEWIKQNDYKYPKYLIRTAKNEEELDDFVQQSIYSWIHQNPDLVDLKGKNLNKAVKNVFVKIP